MKYISIKDIAKKYGIDAKKLSALIFNAHIPAYGAAGEMISSSDVKKSIELYKDKYPFEFLSEQEKETLRQEAVVKKLEIQRQREEAMKRENERQAALSNILISSGFSFDGYRITKYSGYISGDDAVQIPRSGVFGGNNGQNLTNALVRIRRQALKELKEAAFDLGCNAVIGVDFDYITLEPETANIRGGTLYEPYIICVTANGNAVVIEKEE